MNCRFAFQIRKYVMSAHFIVPAEPGRKSGKDHMITIRFHVRALQELQVD